MENFKKRLKEAMKIRGFTQADLANATNIDRGAISRYVRGDFKPKAKNAILIAEALKVNTPWLLGDKTVPMDIDPNIEYFMSEDDVNTRAYLKLEYSHAVEMNISKEEWCAFYEQFDKLSEESKRDVLKYIYLQFAVDQLVNSNKD